MNAAARRYSVIKSKHDRTEQVVANGLPLAEARAIASRLDLEFKARVEASGKFYSSWTADLHHLQLEELDWKAKP